MIWLILGLLALIAGAALALPLLRLGETQPTRAAYDAQVYRDQLVELNRDIARGAVTAAEAETARTEIARRLLAADDAASKESGAVASAAGGPSTPAVITGLFVALAVPASALALYMLIGSPSLPGRPALEVRAEQKSLAGKSEDNKAAEGETAAALIDRLASVLESRPDDLRGWSLYAGALSRIGRHKEAVTAYRRVVTLAPKDAAVRAKYAEAQIFVAGGTVTPAARQTVAEALALDPKDPRARYYAGLAEYQAGRTEEALRLWLALEAESAPDAPWGKILVARIAKFARDGGIGDDRLAAMRAEAQRKAGSSLPPSSSAKTETRGPSAEQVKEARQMSASQRQSMIRGMVDGLAEKMKQNPEDVAGWLRLGRSYGVLQEAVKSRDAYGRAAALKPGDPEILSRYAESIARATDPGKEMPAELVTVSEQLLKLRPDHGAALWFSGMARAQAGDANGARERWTRLLGLLDPASPQHANVKSRLGALPPATDK